MTFMDGVAHLLTPEGRSLLDSLPAYDSSQVDGLLKQLRAAGYPPDLVAAALTQQRLRARGQTKFGERAQRMLFTEHGVQQATRAAVARLHANRYVRAGCSNILDMTSGIGADSMAFLEAGLQVTAVDADSVTAACAAQNLAGYVGARVICADSLSIDLGSFDGVFADPARRSQRGRTFNPLDYSPPLDRVLATRRDVSALGVKVAPGIGYADIPSDAHAQWISIDGDVVETGLWFGPLAEAPGRSALIIRGEAVTEIQANQNPRAPIVPMEPRPLGQYVYDPDGAVIRSGALHLLADELDAAPVSRDIAYLTGDRFVSTPLARCFQVVDQIRINKLAAYLRERGVGVLEILKRGTDIVPDEFRKRLKLRGESSATVILTRLQGSHAAVVAKPL